MIRHPSFTPDKQVIDSMIRVNHAGEYGARRIYEGQLRALKNHGVYPVIQEMYQQELKHLETFDALMQQHHVRPTVLSPVWHGAAYALGWLSGKLGPKVAMAVTIAVEEVIDQHYQEQEQTLKERGIHPQLQETIATFRQEECDHRDQAIEHQGAQAPLYGLISRAVGCASKVAIALSKRF